MATWTASSASSCHTTCSTAAFRPSETSVTGSDGVRAGPGRDEALDQRDAAGRLRHDERARERRGARARADVQHVDRDGEAGARRRGGRARRRRSRRVERSAIGRSPPEATRARWGSSASGARRSSAASEPTSSPARARGRGTARARSVRRRTTSDTPLTRWSRCRSTRSRSASGLAAAAVFHGVRASGARFVYFHVLVAARRQAAGRDAGQGLGAPRGEPGGLAVRAAGAGPREQGVEARRGGRGRDAACGSAARGGRGGGGGLRRHGVTRGRPRPAG